VHLAKVLKEGGNVILLDEPTNDLDVETLRALEEALLSFPGCAVVISHDRWFLDRIATHILAFEGNSEVVWFEGNYSGVRRGPEEAPRRRRRAAAPRPLQAARGMNGPRRGRRSRGAAQRDRTDGLDLDLGAVAALPARAAARLAPAAIGRMQGSVKAVERVVAQGDVTYGINTGFGAFANRVIPAAKTRKLQLNLIRSHACGTGDPLPLRTCAACCCSRPTRSRPATPAHARSWWRCCSAC
jgi:energy-coupling factor transporter ATP-binding protein EcfA2